MDEDSAEFNFKQGKTTVQDTETVNSHESVDFYYTESQNAPIESENVTTESETAIIEEETIQQSETLETPDMEKADLDVVKKNLDMLLREGIITQAEYDESWKEQQELNALADENGIISGSDIDNYYAEKFEEQFGSEWEEARNDFDFIQDDVVEVLASQESAKFNARHARGDMNTGNATVKECPSSNVCHAFRDIDRR